MKQHKNKLLCGSCILFVLFLVLLFHINVNAETTSISRSGYVYANGHPESVITTDTGLRAFCIEYGKHYTNKVNDMAESTYNGKDLSEFTLDDNWVGWGDWTIDGGNATLDTISAYLKMERTVVSVNRPSSRTYYNSGSQRDINNGARAPYDVIITRVGENENWDKSKRLAASVAGQYIATGRCLQVVIWAIENGQIWAEYQGDLINIHFASTCDDFILNEFDYGSNSGGEKDADADEDLSGVVSNADGNITGFFNESRDYDCVSEYRRFVWIVTNWHQRPSFSSESAEKVTKPENLIHLKWDDTIYNGAGGYTTTVNDENGVLDWYDFGGSLGNGVDVRNNGDGTLTISTRNKIKEI